MSTHKGPVTVVISRRVKPGKERAFEAVSAKMTEAASRFPGYLGAVLLPPCSADDPEYRVVFKFDTREHLDAWMTSEERSRWLQEIESLLVEPSKVEVLSGLTPWFSLPGENPVQPPSCILVIRRSPAKPFPAAQGGGRDDGGHLSDDLYPDAPFYALVCLLDLSKRRPGVSMNTCPIVFRRIEPKEGE